MDKRIRIPPPALPTLLPLNQHNKPSDPPSDASSRVFLHNLQNRNRGGTEQGQGKSGHCYLGNRRGGQEGRSGKEFLRDEGAEARARRILLVDQ